MFQNIYCVVLPVNVSVLEKEMLGGMRQLVPPGFHLIHYEAVTVRMIGL